MTMTRQQRLALSIAVLAAFVAFLDGSVTNVALPAISADLGGGLSTQQWVVDAYLITLGALILVAGSVSDVYGRLVVLRTGLWGFGIASALCALAPSVEFLIGTRALQGVAGALLVPSALALIMSVFRGAAQAKAIGTWTAFTSAAFVAGPLVGGALVDLLSWRFVFAINLIPIALTLILIARVEHRDVREPGVAVDYLGAVLAVVGVGAPVFALIEQANLGWSSPAIWAPMAIGVLAFCGFLWRQAVARQPMMPLALFRVRNFAVGNLATLLIYAGLSASGFLIVVFLQQGAEYTATAAGIAALPVTLILIALSSYFGGLAGRFGPRWFMAVGPILAGIGHLMMLSIELPVNYWQQVLPGIVVFGLGMSITVAPLTAAILGSISARQSGIGSAINNAISRVAGLAAIAFIGIVVGGALDVEGLHRGLLVVAVLLIAGGAVSALGIRNLPAASGVDSPAVDAPEVGSPAVASGLAPGL